MGVTVVLAEDSLLVREGIVGLLAGDPSIAVVGQCGDLDALIAAVDDLRPDVVVTDIRMPPTQTDEGIRASAIIAERHPDTGVVVLSSHADPAYAIALLEPGYAGRSYLLKDRVHDRAQLTEAIHSVAVGGSVIDPKIIAPLMAARERHERSPLHDLTPREREVLAAVAEGRSNAAIAASLFLTKRAVEKHINSIFMKLNLVTDEDVSRRVKATLLFLADQG